MRKMLLVALLLSLGHREPVERLPWGTGNRSRGCPGALGTSREAGLGHAKHQERVAWATWDMVWSDLCLPHLFRLN